MIAPGAIIVEIASGRSASAILAGVARSAKTIQMALDELDCPCAASEIEDRFIPNARVALGILPGACFDSIARVAAALAGSHRSGEIPTGYGAACVRHFGKRSEQLERALRGTIERRFALIEIASLASIAGRWANSSRPPVTQADHEQYLRCVAQVTGAASIEREQWRIVVSFLLQSSSSTATVLRNVAYALVWCGSFSPIGSEDSASATRTDEQLARQIFREDRAGFVRCRLEALRWLPKLLEISLHSQSGGRS